jgi:hypothetical protein
MFASMATAEYRTKVLEFLRRRVVGLRRRLDRLLGATEGVRDGGVVQQFSLQDVGRRWPLDRHRLVHVVLIVEQERDVATVVNVLGGGNGQGVFALQSIVGQIGRMWTSLEVWGRIQCRGDITGVDRFLVQSTHDGAPRARLRMMSILRLSE